jgi:hypothetical protein
VSDRLLTSLQVAERWGVSQATVLDWWEAGDLPCGFRLRGRKGAPVRFPESGLDAIERSWRESADAPGREGCQQPRPAAPAGPDDTAVPGVAFLLSATEPPTAAADEKET